MFDNQTNNDDNDNNNNDSAHAEARLQRTVV